MLGSDDQAAGASLPVTLVPVELGGHAVLVVVSGDGLDTRPGVTAGEEQEVSARGGKPTLEQVLDGLAGFAAEVASRLKSTDATRVGVQFGCDIGVESGSLVAVIGKASVSSSITVSLEWDGHGP